MLLNIDFYKLFYWLTVACNFKSFVFACCVILSIVFAIALIWYLIELFFDENTDGDREKPAKMLWRVLPFFLVFWLLYILIPDKKDTLMIVAGGAVGNFLTTDSSAKQLPADLTRFLHVKLMEASSDSPEIKELLLTPEQKAQQERIDKLKSLSKDEIIDQLQKQIK